MEIEESGSVVVLTCCKVFVTGKLPQLDATRFADVPSHVSQTFLVRLMNMSVQRVLLHRKGFAIPSGLRDLLGVGIICRIICRMCVSGPLP